MPKKSNIGIKVDYDYPGKSITCHVWDSEKKESLESETFHIADVDDSLLNHILCYGLSKVLQDRNSATKDKYEKLAAMSETFNQLTEGTWQAERQVGARVVSAEIEAVANVKKVSTAAIQKTKADLTEEQWAKVLENPKVKAEIEKVKAARESGDSVDMSDLIG